MKRLQILTLSSLLFIIGSSHELFLKTDAYFLNSGQASELYLFNGTFDKSENVITSDRISDATIIGPDYEIKIGAEEFYDKGMATYYKFNAGKNGTYLAGISTLPRMIELNAKDFNDYLDHEGLEKTLEERKMDGSHTNGAKEKYSKHVKALLQVGDKKTDEYKKVLGYPIEFVPALNPYLLKTGQAFPFKLLWKGKPLANQVVHYSTSVPGKDAHENEKSTMTNENGIASIVPTESGNWYIATIHIEKSKEENVDYESNWATLTFGVK